MPLTPRQSKIFVIGFLVALVTFIGVATVLILQGQNNPQARARLERIEAERRGELPRLRDAAVYGRDTTGAGSTGASSTR